jgi:hypothetical protein
MFAEENGPAGPKDLDHAMIGVQEMVDEATKRSIKMVELMRQCPLDEDQIH